MRCLAIILLLAATAQAATVTKSIGSGKDYSTVTLWEAASYGATASDDAVGQLYGTVVGIGILNDNTPLSVKLEAAPGEEHDGTPGSGATMQAQANYGLLSISSVTVPIVIEGITFDSNGTQTTTNLVQISTSSDVTINRCIVHGTAWTTTSAAAGILTSLTGSVTITNNIVLDLNGSGTGTIAGIYTNGSGSHDVYNNTVVDIDTSNASGYAFGVFMRNDIDHTYKNNLVSAITASGGGTGYDYVDGALATHFNNISEDATSPDTSFRSKTITFVDAGSDDYHLDASETDAIDAGIGPSSDANVPTDDIDADTRSGTESDIGADEYVSDANYSGRGVGRGIGRGIGR